MPAPPADVADDGPIRALSPGDWLQGRYVIEQVLGQGGMGAVYLARQTQLWGRRVAVKQMVMKIEDPELRAKAVEQFQREAEILAALDHPGMAKILDFFEEHHSQYLVMEFVDGATLDDLAAAREDFMDVATVYKWTDELCEVLDYLHHHSPPVIFRDLKPSNIMLDAHGKIRLIDFGIAQVQDAAFEESSFGRFAVTAGYSPPEQHAADVTDVRSDVYSLGATLYALLARRPPPMAMALAVGEEELASLHEINPPVSEEVEAIVRKMLEVRPPDRYQSVTEVRAALHAATRPAEAMDVLNEMLSTDELTGIRNRRFFLKQFPLEAARAQETQQPLSLSAVDVDYFKTINDLYGHGQGDALLVQMSHLMRELLPPGTVPIRYGGDEFLILMPGCDRSQATQLLKDLAARVKGTAFAVEGSKEGLSVTLSIGVASYPEDTADPRLLYELADKASFISKRLGRDRVSVLADEIESTILDLKALHKLFPCRKMVGRKDLLREAALLLVPQPETDPRPKRMMAILGSNGYGKSRMLEEIGKKVDPRYCMIVRGGGQPHLVAQPFGMLVEALDMAIRTDPMLATRLSAPLDATQIHEVSRFLPALSRFAIVQTSATLNPEERKQTLVGAFARMLLAWAGEKSPVLLLDDFQWADGGTVDVLAALKADAHGRHAAAFLAVQPSEQNPPVADYLRQQEEQDLLVARALEVLDAALVREMVEAILPALQFEQAFIDLLYRKSHGLPLLAEEVLKFLIQREYIRVEGRQVVVKPILENEIPDNIEDILSSRVQQLDQDIIDLVTRAAVLGERFTVDDLKALDPGKNEGYILDLLDRAQRAHLVEADPDNPDLLHFASERAHDMVYNAADPKQRARLHEKAAAHAAKRLGEGNDAVLGELSWHYEKAGDMDQAVQYAEQLVKQYSTIVGENTHPLLLSRTAVGLDWPREVPLPERVLPEAVQVARHLVGAYQAHRMYDIHNKTISDMEEQAFTHLGAVLHQADAITFAEANGVTLVNGVSLPRETKFRQVVDDLIALMMQNGLKGIAFRRGVHGPEMRTFISLLCLTEKERADMGGWTALARARGLTNILVNETMYVQVGQKDIVVAKDGSFVIKEVAASPDEMHQVYNLASVADALSGRAGPGVPEERLAELEQKLTQMTGLLEELAHGQPSGSSAYPASGPDSIQTFEAIVGLQQDVQSLYEAVLPPLGAEASRLVHDPEVLCAHLESGDAHKVAAAMTALADMGSMAVPPLYTLLIRTGDPRARKAALRLLDKHVGPQGVCDHLKKEVFRTEHRHEVINVLHALSEYQFPDAIRTVGTFIHNSDKDIRRAAMQCMEKTDSMGYRNELMKALKSNEAHVRADAAISLGHIGAREAVDELCKMIKPRTVLFYEEDFMVQRQACRALGLIGDARAIHPLIEVLHGARVPVLYHKTQTQVRAAAAMALGEFEGKEVEKVLVKACRDASVNVRAAAKVALNRVRGLATDE